MPIPQNAQAIWNFLLSHGFVPNAAAGVLGNIEQESGGNPATPGGGLIQILSGNPGYTSDPSLSAQMQSIITYIKAIGSIADINAHAATPQDAALYFSTKYERPNPSQANNANREQSAVEVLAASKSGNWSTTPGPGGGGGSNLSLAGNLLGLPDDVIKAFKTADTLITTLMWLTNPSHWFRIGAFFAGTIFFLIGVYMLAKAGGLQPPKITPIPIPM